MKVLLSFQKRYEKMNSFIFITAKSRRVATYKFKGFFFAANIISSGCDYYENSSMIWTKIIDYEKEMLKLVNLHYSKINKNKCVSYVSIFLGKV